MNPDHGASLLRALAHPLRLRILATVQNELPVAEIEARSGIGQPVLSQQLAQLRRASLVQTRRDGKQVFYRIDPERIGEIALLIGTLMPDHPPENAVDAKARIIGDARGGVASFAEVVYQ